MVRKLQYKKKAYGRNIRPQTVTSQVMDYESNDLHGKSRVGMIINSTKKAKQLDGNLR